MPDDTFTDAAFRVIQTAFAVMGRLRMIIAEAAAAEPEGPRREAFARAAKLDIKSLLILRHLDSEPRRQKDLREYLHLPAATMTEHVRQLVNAELATKETSRQDRRDNILALTESGVAVKEAFQRLEAMRPVIPRYNSTNNVQHSLLQDAEVQELCYHLAFTAWAMDENPR